MKKALLSALAMLVSLSVAAQELSIALSTPITSLDPHFHNLSPNNGMSKHFFDPLVKQDEQQRLKPGLAESWKPLDDTTWEFKLRKGVKFHDGSDFTADDVIATFKRVPSVPNSPSSLGIYTRPIKEAVATDRYTLRLKTERPYPLLPNDLSGIQILPRKVALVSTLLTSFSTRGRNAIESSARRLRRIVVSVSVPPTR